MGEAERPEPQQQAGEAEARSQEPGDRRAGRAAEGLGLLY